MKYSVPEDKELHVAISGKSGCGNTTVSSLLAEKLGIPMINYTFRQLAAEKGKTLAEIIELAKTDNSYDVAVDTTAVKLAKEKSSVLGNRLAIWMYKEADLKVYLYASDEERAKRILKREGGNLQEIMDFTSMRDRQDSGRYMTLYNIDNNVYDFADLIIDTEKYNPEQIVDLIADELKKRNLIVEN